MTEGRESSNGPEVGAEEYLVQMMNALTMEGGMGGVHGSGPGVLVGANCTTGMVKMVRGCLEGCEWKLLEEAHATLGKLVGITPGMGMRGVRALEVE